MKYTALKITANLKNELAIKQTNNEIIQNIVNYETEDVIEYFRTSEDFDPGTLLIHLSTLDNKTLRELCSQYPTRAVAGKNWQILEGWQPEKYISFLTMLWSCYYHKANNMEMDEQGYPFAATSLGIFA